MKSINITLLMKLFKKHKQNLPPLPDCAYTIIWNICWIKIFSFYLYTLVSSCTFVTFRPETGHTFITRSSLLASNTLVTSLALRSLESSCSSPSGYAVFSRCTFVSLVTCWMLALIYWILSSYQYLVTC